MSQTVAFVFLSVGQLPTTTEPDPRFQLRFDCQTVPFVVLSAGKLCKLSILSFFTFIQSHW